jgi:hypothetical protein
MTPTGPDSIAAIVRKLGALSRLRSPRHGAHWNVFPGPHCKGSAAAETSMSTESYDGPVPGGRLRARASAPHGSNGIPDSAT